MKKYAHYFSALTASFFAINTWARPGGGHSFSGGSSSSSSSSSGSSSGMSGGGSGENTEASLYVFIFLLAVLTIVLGIIILRNKQKNPERRSLRLVSGWGSIVFGLAGFVILFVGSLSLKAIFFVGGGAMVFFLFQRYFRVKKPPSVSHPTLTNRLKGQVEIKQKIEQFKTTDPNFSVPLFFDFVGSLYYHFYHYYGTPDFEKLTPFLQPGQLREEKTVGSQQRRCFTEIVIGAIKIKSIIGKYEDYITVEIIANYTATASGKSVRYAVTERWKMRRKKGLLSPEPEKMRQLSCPHCGAPADFNDSGRCAYCNTIIYSGAQQWALQQRYVVSKQYFSTKQLGHYAPEKGTRLPTVVDSGIQSEIAKFIERQEDAEKLATAVVTEKWQQYWLKFQMQVVKAYFMDVYKAWSANEWHKARHLVSDRLYESFSFWIQNYQQAGLRNRLENITISSIDLAGFDMDKFYDTITVRIFASCHDYVENTEGRLIGGSKTKLRHFSEYWSFFRYTDSEQDEEKYELKNCPACGAPADKMGDSAQCGYCGTTVSTGQFSWVLIRITQDELYSIY